MHFLCCFRAPREFVPPAAPHSPSTCCICTARGSTVVKHDRPFEGMAWLPHHATGCGRSGVRDLICDSVVQDMGRGRWRDKDTR